MKLSEKQKEIVHCNDKYCLVVAGAGSGKTRTLTERIKVLLSSSRKGEKVLAVTFSNKAAAELRERLVQSFNANELENKVFVGTIHMFCLELVLQRGHSIGLPSDLHIFESDSDRLEVFVDALESVPRARKAFLNPDGTLDSERVRKNFGAFSKAKKNLRFPSDYDSKPLLQNVYQEYNARMLMQNAIDFDDILLYAYRILSEKESVTNIYRRVYKHICVDEAQDLNKAQYEVIKTLAGETSSIFMVGDPNQAIYGFNGSSSDYMMKRFPEDFPTRKYQLLENYRSSKSVIDAAKIIESTFSMEEKLPIQGEVSVEDIDDEEAEADWVVKKLLDLLNNGHPDIENGKVSLENCAVLARNQYVFKALRKRLDDSGLKYHLRSSVVSGLENESTLFKVFNLSLRLIVNPKDVLHLTELVALVGGGDESSLSFQDLRSSDLLKSSIGQKASEVLEQVWTSLEEHNSLQFGRVLEIIKEYSDKPSNFSSDEERLLVMEDLHKWEAMYKSYCDNTIRDDRNLSHMMRSIALGIANSRDEQKGLTLSTVHMSKGLEFDVVFIIGLSEGTFPDYRALKDDKQLAEERHNMFVAITRSKRLCYLTFPKRKMMPWGDAKDQIASRYFNEIANSISKKGTAAEKSKTIEG